MSTKKYLPLIISLIYAVGFLLYAMLNDISGVDIAIYAVLGYAIVLPFATKWACRKFDCSLLNKKTTHE
ncbi:hypothetical protein SAMN05192588_0238 [Nonlabens sp. Hel1_33_55]|uniref:hypothetical protein n=1 Tax=Nonlabens sp. Hel1_33_55 TaxID=1336802 RepID=UPI000875BE8A|nr:hypothetical protein [Nonlabens sp. Hel1_33_55]SCX91362.1 hypothetical protein SAMN05192588_0238 [Nonlabens sp. Hel1_33_55]